MAIDSKIAGRALDLMREGKVQEADDLIAKAIRDEAAPEPDFDTAVRLYRLLGVIEQSDRAHGAGVGVP